MSTTDGGAAEGTGLLAIVDKPAGISSHGVVAQARRAFATRKVGHAGTLDPMATGVLVLGVDRGTRLLTFLTGADKDYTATVRLGHATTTDDAEGELLGPVRAPDLAGLDSAMDSLRGRIHQRPSAVSAIKVDGTRAYRRVRAGEEVALAEREVEVARFARIGEPREVLVAGVRCTDVEVEVTCSSGTYVRALARDLGQRVGTGGHLTRLRRTRVGPFTLHDASPVADVVATGRGVSGAVALGAAAGRFLPTVQVVSEQARRIVSGVRLAAADVGLTAVPGPAPARAQPVALLGPDGELLAVAEVLDGVLVYSAVFA